MVLAVDAFCVEGGGYGCVCVDVRACAEGCVVARTCACENVERPNLLIVLYNTCLRGHWCVSGCVWYPWAERAGALSDYRCVIVGPGVKRWGKSKQTTARPPSACASPPSVNIRLIFKSTAHYDYYCHDLYHRTTAEVIHEWPKNAVARFSPCCGWIFDET
jgi:hypothetical protein